MGIMLQALTVGSIRSFSRLKKSSFTPKLWQSPAAQQPHAKVPLLPTCLCPSASRAAIPGQELAATERSYRYEVIHKHYQPNPTQGCSKHNDDCPPTQLLLCGVGSVLPDTEETQCGEGNTEGLGLSSWFGTVRSCCPLLKTRNGWLSIFFRCTERCHPRDKRVLRSGVVLKIKNNSPNPNKAKLLSSSHPALHDPHNSNLTPHLQFLPLLTPK